MLGFRTREQCEQFQMMHFGICCATCERWDVECPWRRQDELTTVARPPGTPNLRILPVDFSRRAIPHRFRRRA